MRTSTMTTTTPTTFSHPHLLAQATLDDAAVPTTEPLPVRRVPVGGARRAGHWAGIEADTIKVLVLSVILLAVVAGWVGP